MLQHNPPQPCHYHWSRAVELTSGPPPLATLFKKPLFKICGTDFGPIQMCFVSVMLLSVCGVPCSAYLVCLHAMRRVGLLGALRHAPFFIFWAIVCSMIHNLINRTSQKKMVGGSRSVCVCCVLLTHVHLLFTARSLRASCALTLSGKVT